MIPKLHKKAILWRQILSAKTQPTKNCLPSFKPFWKKKKQSIYINFQGFSFCCAITLSFLWILFECYMHWVLLFCLQICHLCIIESQWYICYRSRSWKNNNFVFGWQHYIQINGTIIWTSTPVGRTNSCLIHLTCLYREFEKWWY